MSEVRPTKPIAPTLALRPILACLLLIGTLHSIGQPTTWSWAKGYDKGTYEYVRDIAVDTVNGYAYSVGTYDFFGAAGTGPFGLSSTNGGLDGFMVKTDLSGNIIWAQKFGSLGNDACLGVAVGTTGLVYVTGFFEQTVTVSVLSASAPIVSQGGSDLYVLCVDGSGVIQWIRSGGGTGTDMGTSVGVNATGVYVQGQFKGAAIFGGTGTAPALNNGKDNIVLLRYDLAGNYQWQINGGAATKDSDAERLAVDQAGVLVTGSFGSGTMTWYDPANTVLGTINATGDPNVYIASVNNAGAVLWGQAISNPNNDYLQANAIAVGCGGVYIAGGTHDNSIFPGGVTVSVAGAPHDHAYLAALDRTTGVTKWVRTASGGEVHMNAGYDLAVHANNSVFLSGAFKNTITFTDGTVLTSSGGGGYDNDLFIARFTPYGSMEWAIKADGPHEDVPMAIAVDNSAGIYIGGIYGQSLNLTPITLAGGSNWNIMLAKISDTRYTYWPSNPSWFKAPARVCNASPPFSLNALLPTFGTGYVDAVPASNGLATPNNIIGPADAAVVSFSSNGSWLVADLTDTIPAGFTYVITWKKNSAIVGTAALIIEASVDGVSWTTHPSPPTITAVSSAMRNSVVLANVSTRYLRITKNNPPSTNNFSIDAIRFNGGSIAGGMWSGTGVSGSTFDPAGLTGPIPITYVVTYGSCSWQTTRTIGLSAPSASGTPTWSGSTCPGNNSGIVVATGLTGEVVYWESSTDGISWTTIAVGNDTIPYSNLALPTKYHAKVANSPCAAIQTPEVVVPIGDTLPPVIACPPNDTLYVGSNCRAAIPDYRPQVTVTDDCTANASITLAQSPAPGSLRQLNASPVTITITATDAAGNAATCTLQAILVDTIPPVAGCPTDVTLYVPATGCMVSYTVPLIAVSDNCMGLGGGPIILDPGGPIIIGIINALDDDDVFDVDPGIVVQLGRGMHLFTDTVSDGSGNIAICAWTVTVLDTISPQITCPQDDTLAIDEAFCAIEIPDYLPVATDNCEIAGIFKTTSPTNGDTVGVGSYVLTYAADDSTGNSAECSMSLEVIDATPPQHDPLPDTMDIVIEYWMPLCHAHIPDLYPLLNSTDCSGIDWEDQQPPPNTDFVVAPQYVYVEIADTWGNIARDSVWVVPVDVEPPVLDCPGSPVSVGGDADCDAALPDVTGLIGVEECYLAGLSQSPAAGSTITGTVTVTVTAVDQAGNTATCDVQVMVIDTTPPVFDCTLSTSYSSDPGDCGANITLPWGADVDTLIHDNCDPNPTWTQTSGPPSGWMPVDTLWFTYEASDASGNTSECTFSIIIGDYEPPVITNCPGNSTVNVDPGSCEHLFTYPSLSATDNCGVAGYQAWVLFAGAGSPVETTGNTTEQLPIGVNTITEYWFDVNGQVATCTYEVTVVDNEAPSVTCPGDQTVSSGSGCSVSCPDYLIATSASDNCTASSMILLSQSPAAGTALNPGMHTITITAADGNGNSSTCTLDVTVEDALPPSISCPANISVNATAGSCGAVVNYVPPVGTDNCAGASTTRTAGLASGSTFPVGVNTVTYTVTDAVGLTASCSFTITVTDNIPPSISCPANISVNVAAGTCGAVVNYVPPVGTDNCAGASTTRTAGLASGSTFPVGVNTVTYTVTDAVGLTASCSFTITVTDNIPPSITCPANISVNATAGSCGAVVNYVPPVGTDNCAGASTTRTAGLASGSTFPVGVNTVTYTVTDAAGLTASCSFTITVTDNIPPSITCPANITTSTNSGCTATGVALGTPTTSDNCGVASVTNDAPASYPVGVTSVTWTVIDNSGNTATCVQTVTVGDSVDPTISCPANVTTSTTSGCTATGVALGTPTSSDNCGVASVTNDAPASYPVGVTSVTWTVIDNSGNTATCVQTVTVSDGVDPTISCPANVSVNTNSGCTATGVALGTPTTSDNCGVASVTNDAPASYPVGVTNVTWTVIDNSGNTATCVQTVTVGDNVDPTISCPANVSVNTNSGCTATGVALGTPTTSDNCGVASVTNDAPASYPVGVTSVTWTVTDNSGNTATCVQTVTVSDNVDPTISCPANITTSTNSGCTATGVALGTPTTSDNCGVASVTNDAPASYPVGVTSVTWTVIDNSGNTATCVQTVTVSDGVDPTISCPANVSVNTNSGCTATGVALGTPTTSDNCGVASVTNDAPASYPVGVTNVTWTVIDNSGNTATCVQTVTVSDNVDPTISCPANITTSTTSGCTATGVSLGSPVTADNCSVASVTNDAPASYPVGVTNVTWTVIDNSGNTATCVQTVTVSDNVDPTISCPANITTSTTSGCTATGVSLGSPVTADNCGVASVTNDAPASYPVGVTSVTWTVTDNSGNTATCVQTVTVSDSVDPTISCPANVSVNTNSGCTATGVALGTPTTSDNCGVASVTNDAPASYPVGVTSVTWTVTDNSGNTATCVQTVTVGDNIDPTISCPANVSVNTNSGCTATGVSLGSPVTADNCGVASVTNDAPASYPVGVTSVTWTVIDNSGNTATCVQTVTVGDSVDPTISCPANVTTSTTSGCTATGVALGTPTTSDNCGVASVTNDAPASYPVGVTSVTWTVTDNSGNTATCVQTVTVGDNIDPTISCPANVSVNTNSGCTATGVSLGSPVTADNCGVASVTNDAPASYPVGVTSVTWTVIDNSGNTATCVQTVTVSDSVDPTITCPANITTSTTSGCTATGVALGTPTSSDNCGVASVTNDAPASYPVGVTSVTWTVIDNSGNTATCVQTVTVGDSVDPTISCPANVTTSTTSGCTATGVALGTPTSSDNCGVASVTNDAPASYPVGVTSVTWTVIDNSGNTATCVQTVTVGDNVDPTISCPANVSVNTNSGCTATGVALGTPTTSDNCGVASVTNDAPASYPVGVTSVTWTVTDNSGNTATCVQTVTVSDNVDPTISCPANITTSTNSGCTATGVALGSPVTADNCAVASVTNDAPAAYPVGVTSVTWTVTDNAGNTSTCVQTVIVGDNVDPSISCPADINASAAPGDCGQVVVYNTPVGTDNCAGANTSLTMGLASGSIFPIGTTNVGYTVIDAGGSTATCTFAVTVNAATPPTLDYGTASFCGDNGTISPVAFTPPGGTFSSATLGSALNTSTGAIDLSQLVGSATHTIAYGFSGPCPQGASVDLTLSLPPDAGDSDAASFCSSDAPIDLFNLLGPDAQGGGTWSGPGGSPFTGIYDPAVHAPGGYDYTVTGTAPCANETETITVAEVTAPDAGNDTSITICRSASPFSLFPLLGPTADPGGSWITPGGTGFTGTVDPASYSSGIHGYIVDGTAPCEDDTAFVTITFVDAPDAGTNGSITVCSASGAFDLFTLLGGTPQAGGTWSYAGSPHGSTYDPTIDWPGAYTYTVIGDPPCANANATVTVTENIQPSAGTNGTMTVCGSGSTQYLIAFLGGFPAGGGVWTDPGGAMHPETYVPSTDGPGVYTYTVSGNPPCGSSSATVTVTEVAAANAGTNGTLTICGNGAAASLFAELGGTPDGSGSWSGPSPVIGGMYDPVTMSPGVYTYTVNGTAPCPNANATILVVEIAPSSAGQLSGDQEICMGGSSVFTSSVNGGSWSSSDVAVATIHAVTGSITSIAPGTTVMTYTVPGVAPCPSVSATLSIDVIGNTSNTTTANTCDSYVWAVDGQTYTTGGSYFVTTGCHTEQLDLTITTSDTTLTTANTCDSYVWAVDGQTYTTGGSYFVTTGCHTEQLDLTITASDTTLTTASACDAYTWAVDGGLYNASGSYFVTTGCHTEQLDLTITASDTTLTTASACDAYTWAVDGNTYTTGGSYFVTTGCHTEQLDLTITTSDTTLTTASTCDSYVWAVDGQTYTTGGSYFVTTGCHTEQLDLTITASDTTLTTASTCDAYTWAVDGGLYNASGSYFVTTGCHTEQLDLTITASDTTLTTASTCDAYTWAVDGGLYNASGSYFVTTGCHTEQLDLTITASDTTLTTASTCDAYTWAVDGNTYTTGGSYFVTTGCHTEQLDLTITASDTTLTTASTCDAYTWAVDGNTYTTGGSYFVTTGCHTEQLDLTITASDTTLTTANTCDSYVWAVDGQTYTTGGSYFVTTGCHTEQLDLTITASDTTLTTASACDAYTWAVDGGLYNASGSYFVTTGCHTEQLDLTITASDTTLTTASACDAYTWAVDGNTYTTGGSYFVTTGCHTEQLDLTITTSDTTLTTASTCDSYVWAVDGQTYTTGGSYFVTTGCHTEQLDLTITASDTTLTTASTCDAYTWAVDGNTYTTGGSYFVTTGCHTEQLDLTITASDTTLTTASTCDSYVWAVDGQTYTTGGSYFVTTGCHTEQLDLTITASDTTLTTASTCDAYTWAVDGNTYTTGGSYFVTTGCHTEQLDLTITTSDTTLTTASTCDSYVWAVDGQTYTTGGSYFVTTGCHTEQLDLTITASDTTLTTASACDSYVWAVDGQSYTTSGSYFVTTGCHTEQLDLTITTSDTTLTTASACDAYTWAVDGNTYSIGGSYFVTTGCHTEQLDLTITTSDTTLTTASTCDAYTWAVDGNTYTTGGSYFVTTGCHTEQLDLTITASDTTLTTASTCDAYTWAVDGGLYNASGSYFVTTGCHTEQLDLTITTSDTTLTTASACDSYVWAVDGQTYTTGGSYFVTTGCHTEQLDLTITASDTTLTTASACDSYVWAVDGQTYTTGGSYFVTTGCHTEQLDLTITTSDTTLTTASTCDSYVWAVDGQTYTTGGSYFVTTGCHTEQLDLTITASDTTLTTASTCDAYTWAVDGNTYTTGGSYFVTTGCHTEQLDLTITASDTTLTTASTCDAYTWAVDGGLYNASGSYFVTTGCHTEQLDLTITASDTTLTTANTCDSYVWAVDGQTYTTGGSYFVTTGCHTEQLDLTITASDTTLTTASTCDSYVWAVDGQTYTTGGSYFVTTGCHTEQLDLTITASDTTLTTASTCDAYTWAVDGNTYTTGGSYFVTTGCHTEQLDLTITASDTTLTTASTCDAYTWAVDGNTYTTGGSYFVTTGCHTEQLDLTITASDTTLTTASTCDAYTWAVDGNTYTTGGSYFVTTGCHTEQLDLTITASDTTLTTANTCDSYVWAVDGQTYTTGGSYFVTTGCHTEQLDLTITASDTTLTTASACDAYTWAVDGGLYNASGSYFVTTGCHTEQLDLTITASDTTLTTASTCDAYTWAVDGGLYNAGGSYFVTTGCHTEQLDLTITASDTTLTTASTCDAYTWAVDGNTYTTGGSYFVTTGCHTEQLDLTITASDTTLTTASTCDAYTWAVDGNTYTTGGSYFVTTGCHTEQLDLTITASDTTLTTANTCDSYVWAVDGQSYTTSGSYFVTTGCHTEQLDLTITASDTTLTTASACDSYVWAVDGQTYTTGGSYFVTTGCHTEQLDLTITASDTTLTTASTCDAYTWAVDGNTYTTGGSYFVTTGCHTEQLDLTITTSDTTLTTASACDSYVWAVDGQTYTTGGSYFVTTGCHTEQLDLTITATGTACDDGNAGTMNDVWGPGCLCSGTPFYTDCLGAINGPDTVGTACDDGNAGTMNDVWGPGCSCSGTPICVPPQITDTITNSPVCVTELLDLGATATGTAPIAWSWTGTGSFLPNNSMANVSVSGAATGTYMITATNDCGSDFAVIDVVVTPMADATWHLPGDGSLCATNDPILLDTLIDGDAGGTWSGDGVSGNLFDPAAVSGTSALITYTVGSGACTDSEQHTIAITPGPTAYAGPDGEVCALTYTLEAVILDAVGQWSAPAGGSFSNAADPGAVVTVSAPGTYPFIWTVGDGQCFASDTVMVSFFLPGGVIWADAGEDQENGVFIDGQLLGSASPGTTTTWTTPGGAQIWDPFALETGVSGLVVGDNVFILTAMLGPCTMADDTVIIHVTELFIPQGFSPNGDQVNDVLVIRGIGSFPGNELMVFNRWGQEVYQKMHYDNSWDGTGHGNRPLPDDTYFYVLNLVPGRTYNGYFIIKR